MFPKCAAVVNLTVLFHLFTQSPNQFLQISSFFKDDLLSKVWSKRPYTGRKQVLPRRLCHTFEPQLYFYHCTCGAALCSQGLLRYITKLWTCGFSSMEQGSINILQDLKLPSKATENP